MNMQQFSIHWARPDLSFVLMLCVIACAIIGYARLRKTQKIVTLLAPSHRIKELLPGYSAFRSYIKMVLFLLGVLFLCLALMRPQWNETEMQIAQEGRDLLIALDISRSMLAQDLEPDRLSFAKEKIRQLVKQLRTERVGLMLFSGSAFLQCPLTDDVGAFLMFLDAIDAETISSGTTAIDQALQEALLVFEKVAERKNKLLIVFTDGEDFSSNLASVKKRAGQMGMHIITVGVGTAEGAPVPLYDQRGKQIGHQLDSKNNVVISRMNEGILYRLAEDTGGVFIPIQQDVSDIDQIKKFVTSFEKEKLHDKQIKQFQDQYAWFLLVSLICLALEWIL